MRRGPNAIFSGSEALASTCVVPALGSGFAGPSTGSGADPYSEDSR